MSEKTANTAPKYKDTVFRAIMLSDPTYLREAYEAIEGVKLDPATDVQPKVLEDVLYRNRLNDVSFLLGGKLIILIEHQSTINNNMPLRLLEYIADLYDGLLSHEQKYKKELVALPWPEFIVLYNGEEPWNKSSDEFTLRLSDAFRKNKDLTALGLDPSVEPPLELAAKVYDINKGHNEEKLHACAALSGYSSFIAKVRECERKKAAGRPVSSLEKIEHQAAIAEAVDWCIQNQILEDFMKKYREEVVHMLYEEWDFDTELKVAKQEAAEKERRLAEEKFQTERARYQNQHVQDQNQISQDKALIAQLRQQLQNIR
jgi:hypothetical protein